MSGGVGEFGSSNGPLLEGVPFTFLNATSAGTSFNAISSTVPSDESWLLLGIDLYFKGDSDTTCSGNASINSTNFFWGDQHPITGAPWNGNLSWRGQLLMVTGDTVELQGVGAVGVVTIGLCAWGRILPFRIG